MDLNAEKVRQIARLAKLRPSPEEEARLLHDLGEILEFFGQLKAADTADAEPMAHPLEVTQRLREDAVREPDRREAYQALAPHAEAGLYRVPRVLGSD